MDVLQRWTKADVGQFLRVTVPRFQNALITNDVVSEHYSSASNDDIELGTWRTLDLEAPPFRLEIRKQWDDDVAGQWTKRVVLCGGKTRCAAGTVLPRSVRRIVGSIK